MKRTAALLIAGLAALTFTARPAHAADTAPETTEFAPASDTNAADITSAMNETPAGQAVLDGIVTPAAHHTAAAHRQQLPTTGFPNAEVAAIGAGLVLVGGLLVSASRRHVPA